MKVSWLCVVPISLQVFPDRDGLLNEEIEVLGNIGGESLGSQNSENLATSDKSHLCNAVRISQNTT